MGNKQGKKQLKATQKEDDKLMVEQQEPAEPEATDLVTNNIPLVEIPFDKYSIPIENVVFEGGGNKGLAYCGAVRVSNFLVYSSYLTRFSRF